MGRCLAPEIEVSVDQVYLVRVVDETAFIAIIYLCAPIPMTTTTPPPTAEALLRPYLKALLTDISSTTHSQSGSEIPPLSTKTSPLFEMFYSECLTPTPVPAIPPSIIEDESFFAIDDSPPFIATMTETSDSLAERAEATFWDVCRFLERVSSGEVPVPEKMWDEAAAASERDDLWE